MINYLQKHLQQTNDLDLIQQLGIKITPHPDYPNLLQFMYSQIDSPKDDPVVWDSRGTILDSANNWKIICNKFRRFFNAGEGPAAVIDWPTAKVQEKLDGSLLSLFWYDNKWQVATKGRPNADGQVYGWNFTFAELFWRTFEKLNYKLPVHEDQKQYTSMFELACPENKIVCRYPEVKLDLLAIKHNEYNFEIPIWEERFQKIIHELNWNIIPHHELKDIEEIKNTFDGLSPINCEGYVVVDKNFNRLKIKHPEYIVLNHLKDSASPKNLLDVVRRGEAEEYIAYFPEYKEILEKMLSQVEELKENLENAYHEISHIQDQKEFALRAKEIPLSAALFSLRGGKISSISEFIENINIHKLMEVLGVKDT